MPEESGGKPWPPGQAAASRAAGPSPSPAPAALPPEPPLFPAGLPVLPRLRFSACRQPGAGGTATDGDWLDVLVLPGGVTGLVIGQAEGPRRQIVGAAARLRATLRELLHSGAAPAEALARLNAAANRAPDIRRATVSLAVLEPATGELRYASTGQSVPVIFGESADGGPSAWPASDPPGGRIPSLRVPSPDAGCPEPGAAVLPPGAVLVLYSGPAGLTEVETPPAGPGPAELADRVCPAVLAGLTGSGAGPATVLAAHRLMAPVPSWSMDLPADPVALRGLRVRLRGWLQELGTAPSDRTDMELAVWEAAVNAIVHGRPSAGPGTVTVRAALDNAGRAVIQVTDRGQWRSAAPGRAWPGGQGLSVIRQATDELDITPGPAGTTVTMRRGLSRPVPGQHQDQDQDQDQDQATAAHHGRPA